MLHSYRDELLCDLAETYHIYDYHNFGGRYVATLVSGLRPSSRTLTALSGTKVSQDTLMMAKLVDDVSFIAWSRTKDGAEGVNRPRSVMAAMLQYDAPMDAVEAFDSGEDFLKAWNKITEGGENIGNGTG